MFNINAECRNPDNVLNVIMPSVIVLLIVAPSK